MATRTSDQGLPEGWDMASFGEPEGQGLRPCAGYRVRSFVAMSRGTSDGATWPDDIGRRSGVRNAL